MDFESINNFLTLSDTLNYSKAADNLHITQPTLTKCIHRLEAELGKKLFFRNNRSVQLTPDGEIVRKHFLYIAAQNRSLLYELNSSEQPLTHHLRVGFISQVVQFYLPGFLKEYLKRHPNVKVHLAEGEQSALIDSYLSGSLDIYIGTENACDMLSHCSKTLLREEPIYMLVPTDSKYAKMPVVDVEDMKDEVFILLGNAISYLTPQYHRNNLIMRICLEHKFFPKTVPCRFLHDIPLMVACNVGVSIATSATKFYSRDCVTFVPILGHENDTLKIYAFYDNLKKEVTGQFVSELQDYIVHKQIPERDAVNTPPANFRHDRTQAVSAPFSGRRGSHNH